MGITRNEAEDACRNLATQKEREHFLAWVHCLNDEFLQRCSIKADDGPEVIFDWVRQTMQGPLTARQAILRSVPLLRRRTSPRNSNTKTKPTYPKTFTCLEPWDFDSLMEEELNQLDDTDRLFKPVTDAGDVEEEEEGFDPAAAECEFRAPLQNVSKLVNAVAKRKGINAKLLGGGSGRSSSYPDYVVRLLPRQSPPQPLPQQQQPSGQAAGGVQTRRQRAIAEQQQPVQPATGVLQPPVQPAAGKRRRQQEEPLSSRQLDASHNIGGSVEVKGSWQVDLRESDDLCSMDDKRGRELLPALQQLYGYMVMDEAPVGILTTYPVAVFVRRHRDVSNKTLYVSKPVGPDRYLLALLTLVRQADVLRDMKAMLSRLQVPRTPTGPDKSSASRDRDTEGRGKGRAKEQQQPEDKAQGRQLRPRQRAEAQGKQQQQQQRSKKPQGGQVEEVQGEREEEGFASPGQPSSQESTACEQLPWCSFADVGLTGICLGYGRLGNVVKGTINGQPAAIKMFEVKCRDSWPCFEHELHMYQKLQELQGTWLPRLLRYGRLDHTGAFFLGLSDEGDPIEQAEQLGEFSSAMRRAVRALHDQGVLHNDIRLGNFVMDVSSRSVKLIDLEYSSELPDGVEGAAAKDEEMKMVDSLVGHDGSRTRSRH